MFLKNASALVGSAFRIYGRLNGGFGNRPDRVTPEGFTVVARIRPTLVFAVLVLAAIGVLGGLAEANADSGRYAAAAPRRDTPDTTADGWVQTPYGPLGPADRDLLVKVRQAGLWEMPMGALAQTRGSTDLVRKAGGVLMNDHMELDVKVRAVAAQLNVPLPDQPNADQQGWMAEIRSKNGVEFDRTWANRLRAAHGKVFIVIAQLRAGTRNTMIREMAQTANTFVLRHITVLENTGMVDYGALPTPPAPGNAGGAAPTQPALAKNEIRTGAFGPMKSATVFLVVVVLLVIAGTVAIDRGPGRSGRLRALFTTSERRRKQPLDIISNDDSDGPRGKRGRGHHHE
jgi:predicted outer membrane protein